MRYETWWKKRGKGTMLRFIVKYRLYFVLASVLIALLFTLHIALPANAVSSSGPLPGTNQQNNQSFHGASFFGDKVISIGHGQDNSGNSGVNHSINQDDSGNAGNAVSGQRKNIKTQVNHQFLHQGSGGVTGSGNSSTLIGAFQGNSGNSGINLGNNQDNTGNFGNQVNNQGNVIGTQINKQGSSVTNDGNIIQHQINYVDLIPGLGIYVSLRPKVQFSVSIGR
jgi:hypothetical protein